MDDVLDQVAIAFEEDGVNHSVLDELKKVWHIFLHLYRSLNFNLLIIFRSSTSIILSHSVSRLKDFHVVLGHRLPSKLRLLGALSLAAEWAGAGVFRMFGACRYLIHF